MKTTTRSEHIMIRLKPAERAQLEERAAACNMKPTQLAYLATQMICQGEIPSPPSAKLRLEDGTRVLMELHMPAPMDFVGDLARLMVKHFGKTATLKANGNTMFACVPGEEEP